MESSIVINSHLRCTSFGLKRNQILNQILPSDSLLKELCRQSHYLIDEAHSTISNLSIEQSQEPIVFAVSDANGYILNIWGKEELLKELEPFYVKKGANWREEKLGTNAIGCVLIENQPVVVKGEEHFFYYLQSLVSYAAPIFDSQARICGVLALFCFIDKDSYHNQNYIALASDAIQTKIQMKELKSNRGRGITNFNHNPTNKNIYENRIYFEDLFSNCPIMDKTLELARKATFLDENILITGETGTGKESLARAIHFSGHRKFEPFVVVSADSIQDLHSGQLLALQENQFIEKILEANKGTLYISSIEDLNHRSQILMSRFILEKKVTPHGDPRSIPVDVRIISSSKLNLSTLIKEKKIRQDLLYKLKGIHIPIPSLKERSDIIGLAKHFLQKRDMAEYTIDTQAQKKLLSHTWPGNLRELNSVILEAAFYSQTGEIHAEDIRINELPEENRTLLKYKITAKDAEKNAILNALSQAKGNVTRASEILGLGRSTLYRKFKQYNISP